MKNLSQGNKGIRSLAEENPALVENRFGYDVPGFFGGGGYGIPNIRDLEDSGSLYGVERSIARNLANADNPRYGSDFDYARDVLGINIVEEDQTALSPEEIEAKLAASRLARGYGSSGGIGPGGNYTSTTPGAPISIDARDETPDAYRFYPSEVSKLYSQMKDVPFSPLVAPPKEATYIDSMQPRRITSQLYAKDGTYVDTDSNAKSTPTNYNRLQNTIFSLLNPLSRVQGSVNLLNKITGGKIDALDNANRGIGNLNTHARNWIFQRNNQTGSPNVPINQNVPIDPVATSENFETGDGGLFGGKERRRVRKAQRAGARDLTTDAEIAAREASDAQRQAEMKQRIQAQSRARGDAMFRENAEALAGTNSGTEGSRGTRRVMYSEGGFEGGFPEREELVTGPGGEKGDKIPAMLSDGEFIFNSAAVRGMGIMAGANPDDEYEQRLMGARKMYEFQKEAEEMAKRYA